ncbi:FERM domain-containing protein 4A-like isoform X3 [Mercenaria mercenaria]|uniref:FERM domain-containing protein 4A-like isoform X3 n=1 Tax=Mercenaria mercenaria TaxID=6596 RepID=UPI00234E717B|nr:FERM domain-containing protein 4A-like isoform X3 [Mercenaria mercenaria]
MSASEKIQRNKKSVGFEDGTKVSPRESRSRSRGRIRDRRAKSVDLRGNTKDGEPRKRDRSLIGLVRQGSRKSVTSLVKLFEAGKSFYMTEGRKCQILLPDERRLELLIQPKLLTWELLDIVASHFKLKEKEYFGLAFQDDTGHYNWLHQEKKVLEHDLPRKQGSNLVISFLVRFYMESITQLRDTSTVELFYLNAKQSVFKGQIECDSETVFELAAHVLQATVGDYVDDNTTKADLKKLPLITTSALKEHPSIQYCEERVIDYYKKIAATTKGSAIVNYMTIIESLPTYGIHYFEVKDKKDIPWWLGISNKGIGVYDKQDKNVPRRVFVWKTLENLYYRDRKFSIEVHDPKRIVHTLSSFNLYEDAIRERVEDCDDLSEAITDPSTQVSVSRRTFGPGNVNVHAWFGLTPQLTKCIWSMAVDQHQFYHERKSSKCRVLIHLDLQTSLPSVRSVSELATELSRSTSSLPGSLGSDISRSGSSASLPSLGASRFDLNFDPADTAKVQREMYSALKARREALEDILRKKTEELKTLCIKEGELTGRLPAETPLTAGEEPPQIRRRVGTAFSLDTNMVTADNEDADMTSKLELELELQKQITSAAHKLASDKSVSRFVRKQRRHSFIKAQSKLKEMEKKLSEYRKGGVQVSPALSGKYDDSDVVSPAQSPLVPRGPRSNYKQHEGRLDPLLHRSNTAPKNFPVEREIASMTLPPTHSSPTLDEVYKPNSVYSTQYRNQTYPTLASRSQSQTGSQNDYENKSGSQGHLDSGHLDNKSGGQSRLEAGQGRLEGSQDSGFSSTNNMYNVNSRRTSRYESNHDLNTPSESHYETLDNVFDNRLQLQSKLGGLENAYNQTQKSYGSLERNLKKRQNREYERKLSDTDTNSEISSNTPSRFGKRTSRSEYDLSSKGNEQPVVNTENDFPLSSRSRNYVVNSPTQNYPSRSDRYNNERLDSVSSHRMIEVPIHHESSQRQDRNLDLNSQSRAAWQDSASTEPSPIIQSPTKRTFNELYTGSGGGDTPQGQCYSPRGYEGARANTHSKPPHSEHKVSVNVIDSPHGVPQATSSKIVTIKMSPHVEVSKPFEMKDFYKYSEKLRRQRLVEQYHNALVGSRASSPSQHSSEGDTHHSTSSYHHPQGSQYGQSTSGQVHPAYRGTSTSSASPYGSPVSSRHMTGNHPYTSQSNASQDHMGYGNSRANSVSSTSSSTTTYGVSTSTSRVQYTVQTQGGRVLYKAQHQSSKQTHYQPPTSMKCEPVRSSRDIRRGSQEAPATPTSSRNAQRGIHHQRQYSTPERTVASPLNMSNFHLSPAGSLSKAFSNEMLEWFDGEGNHAPTSV